MKPNFKISKPKLDTIYLRAEDKAYIRKQAHDNGIQILDVVKSMVKFSEEAGDKLLDAADIIRDLVEIIGDGILSTELTEEITDLLADLPPHVFNEGEKSAK